MVAHVGGGHGLKCSGSHMQRDLRASDPACRETLHELRREVQSRGRRGYGPGHLRKYRLVTAPIVFVVNVDATSLGDALDVGRERDAAELFDRRTRCSCSRSGSAASRS